MDNITKPEEFLAGQQDCRDGVEHKAGRHVDYTRGYATEDERAEANEQLKEWGLA